MNNTDHNVTLVFTTMHREIVLTIKLQLYNSLSQSGHLCDHLVHYISHSCTVHITMALSTIHYRHYRSINIVLPQLAPMKSKPLCVTSGLLSMTRSVQYSPVTTLNINSCNFRLMKSSSYLTTTIWPTSFNYYKCHVHCQWLTQVPTSPSQNAIFCPTCHVTAHECVQTNQLMLVYVPVGVTAVPTGSTSLLS